jgi:predicted small lipoprotein YifL
MRLAMSKRLLFVIAAASALGGCCGLGGACYLPPPSSKLTNWDGPGPYANRDNRKVAKARKGKISDLLKSETSSNQAALASNDGELATLKPYSKEWWVVRQALDRAADLRLAKRMIICRGCLPSFPTGSIDNLHRAAASSAASETEAAQASSCQ